MGAHPEQISWQGDLNGRELWAIAPLIILIILIGIFPSFLLEGIHATTKMIGL
jgi:NADH:ubiquinone oxidoreductase subunit 4 (subunit M)